MAKATKTGVVFDPRYAEHDMGAYHPESPRRVLALNRLIETNEADIPLISVSPRPASPSELQWVHEAAYIDFVKATAGRPRAVLDPDTSTGPRSYETALLAAGGVIAAVDAVMAARTPNAFAIVRPPGHHAESARAMGFCIFNNIAIGAERLIRDHGLRRVLIVDFDVHHGNGTQHHFYDRADLLYFSTHRVPFYPGTGAVTELGVGAGRGFNLNVPLTAGKGDGAFLFIFERLVASIASQYAPEFILVSAGFDIGAGDPLGGMSVSRAGFGALASSLRRAAEASCRGRLVYVLEGGYDIATLLGGVEETLIRLSAENPGPAWAPAADGALAAELAPCFRRFGEFWKLEDNLSSPG
jgi:acetoin utilization deacetylase AcuC-like enzyme